MLHLSYYLNTASKGRDTLLCLVNSDFETPDFETTLLLMADLQAVLEQLTHRRVTQGEAIACMSKQQDEFLDVSNHTHGHSLDLKCL